MQRAINDILASEPSPMLEEDLSLEFHIVLRGKDKVVSRHDGKFRVNSALNKLAISETPQVIESAFHNIVWRPVRIDLMTFLNSATASLLPIPDQSLPYDNYVLPGNTSPLQLPPGE